MRYGADNPGPEQPEIVPGLVHPEAALPTRKVQKKSPAEDSNLTKKLGLAVGIVIVTVVAAMLLAILVIILLGIIHGLWGLFF